MKISIIGVGLIGGSLGLALKEKLNSDIYITGYGRNINNLEEAKKMGAIDNIALNLQEAAQSDIIYLSTPVLSMLPIIREIIPYLSPETIITDAGSTKNLIFSEIKSILPQADANVASRSGVCTSASCASNVYYIAGHPMTGREKSGVTAAKADLFQDKMYVIIKDESTPQRFYDKLMFVLEKTGAKFSYLSIEEHDKAASVISHIPHIAAAGLVHLLNNSEDKDIAINLIGGGFRDTTRIASSNADMWADILMTNGESISKDIDKYIEILSNIKAAIISKNRNQSYDYFDKSKKIRDGLLLETEKKFDIN